MRAALILVLIAGCASGTVAGADGASGDDAPAGDPDAATAIDAPTSSPDAATDAAACANTPCDLYSQCGCTAATPVCDLDPANLPTGGTACRVDRLGGGEATLCTRSTNLPGRPFVRRRALPHVLPGRRDLPRRGRAVHPDGVDRHDDDPRRHDVHDRLRRRRPPTPPAQPAGPATSTRPADRPVPDRLQRATLATGGGVGAACTATPAVRPGSTAST
jgi:hypothetical protein